MSAILLSNPFTPAPAPADVQMGQNAAPIAPAPHAGETTSDGNNDASFGGNSSQQETVALLQARAESKWTRPVNADRGSVFDAQTNNTENPNKLGPDLPKIDPPNPLPTSPLLLWMSGQEEVTR